jgi:mitogen-activated protein kinase kinase kinase
MLTGKRPWHYLDNDWAIMYHIATGRPAFPDELDKEATAFLEACFTQSPADRPTAKGLLEHAWIQM